MTGERRSTLSFRGGVATEKIAKAIGRFRAATRDVFLLEGMRGRTAQFRGCLKHDSIQSAKRLLD